MEPLDDLGDPQVVVLIGRYDERALTELYRGVARARRWVARRPPGAGRTRVTHRAPMVFTPHSALEEP